MERKLHSNLFGNYSHIFFENMMTPKQACFTGTAWLSNSSLQQPLLRNFFYGAVPFDAGACFHLLKYQRWEHCTIAHSRRNILQEINCCGQRCKDIPSALLGIVYIEGLHYQGDAPEIFLSAFFLSSRFLPLIQIILRKIEKCVSVVLVVRESHTVARVLLGRKLKM